ncbi:hypothetical protein SCAR479_09914 [Seiridium cardinale]|uniref:Uncharacterized protein n=1 Tax=Seiridium cardinale TaxID=138064 RepID=A0ABR2XIC1_9PEZI
MNKDAVCSGPANGGPRCNSTLRLVYANSTEGNIKCFDKNAMRRAQRWDSGSPEMPQAPKVVQSGLSAAPILIEDAHNTNPPESSRNSCRGADQPTRTSQGQTMGSIRFEQDEGALREQASVTIWCAGVPPRIIASRAQTRGSRLFEARGGPAPTPHGRRWLTLTRPQDLASSHRAICLMRPGLLWSPEGCGLTLSGLRVRSHERPRASRVAERSAGCRELQPLASGPGLWLAVPRSRFEPRLSATKADVDAASFDLMSWPLFVAAHQDRQAQACKRPRTKLPIPPAQSFRISLCSPSSTLFSHPQPPPPKVDQARVGLDLLDLTAYIHGHQLSERMHWGGS